MKIIKTNSGTLYASHIPSVQELEGTYFDIIWNLTKEFSHYIETEKNYADNVLCAQIEDYQAPTDVRLYLTQLKIVVDALKQNKKVLVHCFGGHGRTGMTVAFIKHLLDKMSMEDAIRFAKTNCKGPEVLEQVTFLKRYSQ